MSRTILVTLLIFVLGLSTEAAEKKEVAINWYEASSLTVEGRGWEQTETFFHRLPKSAHGKVIDPVWWLGADTAGIAVRFVSDSPEFRARWELNSPNIAMNHMAASGVSGLDLYVRHNGKWRWLAVGRPTAQANEAALIVNLPKKSREYTLYLPLYNGVSKLEIGVPEGSKIEPAPPRTRDMKPVVFYGTSITQGGCATRPGMAYPAIIGRWLDVPTINLGFSGNGRCEPEVADLLAELDPSVYVIDCLPNMSQVPVDERIRYLLDVLRRERPKTPVVLVENITYQNTFIRSDMAAIPRNETLAQIFKEVSPQWNGLLYYVKGDRLLGDDGEGTVDGTHPTDVGFLRIAEVLSPVVEKALSNTGK